MRYRVQLSVGEASIREEILEIKEHKLGDLTEEEIQNAIETNIRSWLDRILRIEWEVLEEE
jgi:hypothetical protein